MVQIRGQQHTRHILPHRLLTGLSVGENFFGSLCVCRPKRTADDVMGAFRNVRPGSALSSDGVSPVLGRSYLGRTPELENAWWLPTSVQRPLKRNPQ